MKRRIGYESAAAIANGLIALVAVGQSFALAPNATDPRGGALTFSVVNKPYWADFDTSTGRLAGTPASTDVGVYANVQISASNGSLEALSNSFSVVVEADPAVATDPAPPPDNAPPTISGNPAQYVTEGQAYSFQPSATDPDNDALTFSILNRPFWASFDTGTGALTGTPPAVRLLTGQGIGINTGNPARPCCCRQLEDPSAAIPMKRKAGHGLFHVITVAVAQD